MNINTSYAQSAIGRNRFRLGSLSEPRSSGQPEGSERDSVQVKDDVQLSSTKPMGRLLDRFSVALGGVTLGLGAAAVLAAPATGVVLGFAALATLVVGGVCTEASAILDQDKKAAPASVEVRHPNGPAHNPTILGPEFEEERRF